ncbi:MAG: MurR/RpiR family transcriptional regulator [Solobacterium sp.]|nr:MurR/RpiR family transcriptional regulator [Solobacterium sp.]
MEPKDYILNTLITFVNSSEKETNETIVARAIIENRDKLDRLSLESIARRYHVSQPTISRFIRKLGFSGFSELKSSMKLSRYIVQQASEDKKIGDITENIRSVHTDIITAVDEILNVDENSLKRLAQQVLSAKRICFMGSELSMSILRLLQHKLLSMGKDVYTILQPGYQNEVLSLMDPDALLVAVSVAGRWLPVLDREALQKCRCTRILLAGHPYDWKKGGFDACYYFSTRDLGNQGYHTLMSYVMILNRMLYQE